MIFIYKHFGGERRDLVIASYLNCTLLQNQKIKNKKTEYICIFGCEFIFCSFISTLTQQILRLLDVFEFPSLTLDVSPFLCVCVGYGHFKAQEQGEAVTVMQRWLFINHPPSFIPLFFFPSPLFVSPTLPLSLLLITRRASLMAKHCHCQPFFVTTMHYRSFSSQWAPWQLWQVARNTGGAGTNGINSWKHSCTGALCKLEPKMSNKQSLKY